MAGNDELTRMIAHIPTSFASTPELRCCCGSPDCVFLRQNCLALEQLEHEVRTAAQLGQALLSRHEHYMHHAERERAEMSLRNEQLINEKKDLEERNAKTQQTNRQLFNQLEELNQSISTSETHIKALEATLDSTRYEFRRLQALAARTEDLESQLATLEQEQEVLRSTIWTTQEQKQTAVFRWKSAERRLIELQEQLESIDSERRAEKDRHAEVITRMKRQRALEKETDTSARLWKEKAEASGLFRKNGSDFVSNFVKQVLQDNANLQSGIMELRGMLSNSNDEVQTLREQLIQHQPLCERDDITNVPNLKSELAQKGKSDVPIIAHHLRIHHHHYHASSKIDKSRKQRRKQTLSDHGLSNPPRPPKIRHRRHDTNYSTTSQTSIVVPGSITPARKRWSQQTGQFSDFTASSVTSSLQSGFWLNSIFDKGCDLNSSNPTSPGSSVDHRLPIFDSGKKDTEFRRRSTIPMVNLLERVIHEDRDETGKSENPRQPGLFNLPFFHLLPRLNANSMCYSKNIITGPSLITARPIIVGQKYDSKSYLRSHMPANSIGGHSIQSSDAGDASLTILRSNPNAMKTKLGSWFREPWGSGSPQVTSAQPSCVTEVSPAMTKPKGVHNSCSKAMVLYYRPPGINQKGPVPGYYKKYVNVPCQILPNTVDQEALREVLEENFSAWSRE